MKRVVVTGMGIVSPIGMNLKENWDGLQAGRSGIKAITLFDTSQFSTTIAGEISSYKAENFFPVKEIKKIDRFIQFALIAGEEALKASGLNLSSLDLERVGTSVGVGLGGLGEIEATYRDVLAKGPRRVSPFFIPSVIGNLAAGQLSIKYGLKGPNTCVTTACSSSAHSVGESARLIQRGDVDVMFAGGAEAVICELGIAGFSALRALSQRNNEPEKASRPFDKDRDGFVVGEGAAVLMLEEYEFAKKRGAPILCELRGYGLNSDGFHMTQPSPEGEGAARCMKLALKDAKLNPEEVGYINAHGTSTPIGDLMETLAIKSVFGEHSKRLLVSSTKSMTGHLLGAAGAVESVYSVLALLHQTAPPTLNLENPSEGCDLNYVPNQPLEGKFNHVLSNSFGFGGTNGSLIFSKL